MSISINQKGAIIERTATRSGSPLDISSYTTKEFLFFTPDGGKFTTKTGTFTTDGTDGKLRYTSVADEFNVPGSWPVRMHLVKASEDLHSLQATDPLVVESLP